VDSAYSHADDSFHARLYFLADRENSAIYHFSVRGKETLLKIDHALQKTRRNNARTQFEKLYDCRIFNPCWTPFVQHILTAKAGRLKAGGLNLGIEN
jgi:hypothetical protein